MLRFIEPVIDRMQYCFLRETLDESIPQDHPVRVFDFLLDCHDWREWHGSYPGGGRPAYPPEVMSKLLAYGYNVGIRSSRTLEYACWNNRDFIWLMSGRTPDHDTIADFRRRNAKKFKKIFRTTVATCVEAGIVSLKHFAVDGTRAAASNSSAQTKTAADIEAMLPKIDQRIEEILKQADEIDNQEDTLFGKEVSPNDLPKELKDLQKRQVKLKQALEKVQAKAQKAMENGVSEKEAAKKRVPITDTDSDVMKNKDGGFGPNFTPYLGVDTEGGVVLTEGVTDSHQDADHLQPAIEEAQENTGLAVAQVQADSNYSTAENVMYCEDNHIDPCMAPQHTNMDSKKRSPKVPAWPDDVPKEAAHLDGSMVDGPSLPRTSEGKFDKSAFKYHAEKDCYECPTGQMMPACGTVNERRAGRTTTKTKYRCSACQECPFLKVCTTDAKGRTVKRSADEEVHERQRARMNDPTRKEQYKSRRQTVEPTIGIFKEVFRLRRFLLRGLEYVRAEWTLAAAAFNLKKLAAMVGLGRLIALRNSLTA